MALNPRLNRPALIAKLKQSVENISDEQRAALRLARARAGEAGTLDDVTNQNLEVQQSQVTGQVERPGSS